MMLLPSPYKKEEDSFSFEIIPENETRTNQRKEKNPDSIMMVVLVAETVFHFYPLMIFFSILLWLIVSLYHSYVISLFRAQRRRNDSLGASFNPFTARHVMLAGRVLKGDGHP